MALWRMKSRGTTDTLESDRQDKHAAITKMYARTVYVEQGQDFRPIRGSEASATLKV